MGRLLLSLFCVGLAVVHGAPCHRQNLEFPDLPPEERWLGVVGYRTAISQSGDVVVVSAPGQQGTENKTSDGNPIFESKGNVYPFVDVTANIQAPNEAPSDALLLDVTTDEASHLLAPESAAATAALPTPSVEDGCPLKPLPALEKPPVSSGRAQAFGLGLALTPSGSTLLTAVAGCYVPEGGQPAESCPDFPGSPAASVGAPGATDNARAALKLATKPDDWLSTPADPVADDAAAPAGFKACSNTAALLNPGLYAYGCHCSPTDPNPSNCGPQLTSELGKAVSTTEEGFVDMDMLWLYKRVGLGSEQKFVLDRAASQQLKVTGPGIVNQTMYPDQFFYSSPMHVWSSISEAGDAIAVNAMVASVSKDSKHVPLVLPSGVQVFRRDGPTRQWQKVMYMRNITRDGKACKGPESPDCYQYYPRATTVSPNGELIATTWGFAGLDAPVTIHAWDGKNYTFSNMVDQSSPSVTTPAFSPDSSVLALGSIRLNLTDNTLYNYVQLYNVKKANRGVVTVVAVGGFVVPGVVEILPIRNALGDLKLFWGPRRKSLLLGVTRSNNSTLIYKVPGTNTPTGFTVSECPQADDAIYSVSQPGKGPGYGVGWGAAGTQAFSAIKLVAGMPGMPGDNPENPDVPVAAAGAAVVSNYKKVKLTEP